MTGKETEFRNKMRTSIHKYCKQFVDLKEPGKIKVKVQRKVNEKIIHLANLVAVARTGIDRDRYTRILNYTPHPAACSSVNDAEIFRKGNRC